MIPKTAEEFVERFPLFCEPRRHSRALRTYVDKLCLGLGLPVLKDKRPSLWGYKLHPEYPDGIYMPIESDLKCLAQARHMHISKEYTIPDIINWLASCPLESGKIKLDNFYYLVKTRPFFEESVRPFEERAKLIHDFFRYTPAASTQEGAIAKGLLQEECGQI